MHNLKAVRHISVSNSQILALSTGFDRVNLHLHRPTGGFLPKPVMALRELIQILSVTYGWCKCDTSIQGLTLAHFRAQLEGLRDTLLMLELNLSTLGTHPRVVTWGTK